jgi:hypothetical protein
MPDPNHRGKLLADLESVRSAYRLGAGDFDHASKIAVDLGRVKAAVASRSAASRLKHAADRYQTAMDAYLEFLRREW